MQLDYQTMGIVLWAVSIIVASVMAIVWRINRQERGPALWALSGAILAFSFLPLVFRGDIGSAMIFVNNLAAIIALLLLLEGILRFKGLGNERRRLPWYGLYLALVVNSLFFSLDNHQLRYLVLDANLAALLVLTAPVLVWRSEKGLERVIYSVVAVFFVLMAAPIVYRWGLAAMGVIGADSPINPASQLVMFASIPWALVWTYGLAMVANLRAQCRVEQMAQHDYLTGLPNRRLLSETIERMADRVACEQGRSERGFGVIAVDVNGFKAVNDRYGHAFGDAVLVKLADLLVQGLRPEDKVVRLGGDEFLLLLPGLINRKALDRLCERVTEVLKEPVQIKGCWVRFSASLGAAFCPDDGIEPDQLLALADQRMYVDKSCKQTDSEVWYDAVHEEKTQRSGGGLFPPDYA
ncbi:MAG: diguanylate cyclase domain-containing protein [Halorhodospira sp.]